MVDLLRRQAGCQLRRPESQPRNSRIAAELAAVAAVLVVAIGPARGRTFAEAATVCTPSDATASLPARRQSDTIAAGVNCGRTMPNTSCVAAAAAHHAS